jgi:hypothetical protein
LSRTIYVELLTQAKLLGIHGLTTEEIKKAADLRLAARAWDL